MLTGQSFRPCCSKFLFKCKEEENNNCNKSNSCDKTCIRKKISKTISESSTDYNIWRITAHCCRTAKVSTKISAKTIGTGLNLSNCESSTVTAARKRITVILSINIERTALIIIKVTSIGITLYLTALAIVRQSQRKSRL